jgi:hypothetical protein
MARWRGVAGRASLGVVAEIDQKLRVLEDQLGAYEALVAERERLRHARATLTGEPPPGAGGTRASQDDVAAYLAQHPGSRVKPIAQALGVAMPAISSHLYRGRHTRFERREDGWYLRAGGKRGGPRS